MSMLQHRPSGFLARAARAPSWLARHGLGWTLGTRFLVVTHRGRRSGRVLHTPLEVVDRVPGTGELLVISAWGDEADWLRNIRAHPALEIAVGGHRFVPRQRFLGEDEALVALRRYRRRHPLAFRALCALLGWPAGTDGSLGAIARSHPMVAFAPAAAGRPSGPGEPARVGRPRHEAARTYDRLSRVYDLSEGLFERGRQDLGLRLLAAGEGERILEVGHGTGRCLAAIAEAVGPDGRVAGIDLSPGMHRQAERRLRRTGLEARCDLHVGDATALPFGDGSFDAVFMSFVLELFDTPDIPQVLGECRRVLRPGGRIAVVSLALDPVSGPVARAYLWGHERFPRALDCRPIPVADAIAAAGFEATRSVRSPLFGLRVDAVLARRP